MRLTTQENNVIKAAVRTVFGPEAQVRVFGSKTDDTAKGGDIDLMVTVPHAVSQPAWDVARAKAKIIMNLGECEIDLLLDAPNLSKLPIHQIARDQGIML
ncbi:MAG: nucleotidyltransferase domain-containing protein [Candidatus Competibacteraceae bacterium]|jgi:predicted nucleotidyltransferase|nr:MAG: nucleotidyltransferase domain-containing protein [Candidatus Competibacteraceae bacterium]